MTAVKHRGSENGVLEILLRDRAGALLGFALIDDCDAHLAEHTWSLRSDGYVVRRKSGRLVRLHREVMGFGPGDPHVDHINFTGRDCRRSNLRAATPAQNHQNRQPVGGTSSHRGVWWDSARRKWAAGITVNYRKVALGRFDFEQDAAEAAAAARADLMPFSQEARHA